ncbi:unnamed protein product [Paramecium sonneborni]|uniref:Uncharacterized protein n=1 Tax=Paramecium sonneborni TaxID=65129 RepID=A0A8S1KM58_9CILI|nr:unnamed protein product [Paramecium sonneborni]
MGQTQTSVVIKQNALYLTQKNTNRRLINKATEINKCLSLTLMLDQLSFESSTLSNKVSTITINPLSYEPFVLELLKKENIFLAQSQIIYQYEVIRNEHHQNLLFNISPEVKIKRKDNLNQQAYNEQTLTIDDYDIANKLESNQIKKIKPLQLDIFNINLDQQKEVSFQSQRQLQNQFEIQNAYVQQKQKTENFSDDEIQENNSLSISQNFAEFQKNQGYIDEKSYLQNNKFWSSDHSSTFIDFQIINQNISSQYNNQYQQQIDTPESDQKLQQVKQIQQQNPNQRITNQQSFGTIKTLNYNQQPQISHLTTSPSVFSQNKLLKQQQIQNNQFLQQFPLEQNQNLGYTQLYSNKKLNSANQQINTMTPIHQSQNNNIVQSNQFPVSQQIKQQQQIKQSNFNHSASPQAQMQLQQGQQKESMRQQFDRLLRENKEQKLQQKSLKNDNLQNVKSSRKPENNKNQNQNVKKQIIHSPTNDKIPKKQKMINSQSPLQNKLYQQQAFINNGIGYVEMNNIKKKYHRSPEQPFQNLKDQKQIQHKIQEKQKNNLNQLNLKIQNLPIFNQCLEEKSERLKGQKKQDVSNLQTAMTQNISPSEREVKNRPIIKDGINLNDHSEDEQSSINLEELASYRESQKLNLRKLSD